MSAVIAHHPRRPTCRCCDAVMLHFVGDEVHVYAQANVPRRLAAALAAFVRDAIENPSLIPAIAIGTPSPRVRRRAQ